MAPARDLPPGVLAYYQAFPEEERLAVYGRLELLRSQAILRRHLPAPPARVLDAGGGPGAYACWLARLGYEVELVDPVERLLECARAASRRQPDRPVARIARGDARELPCEDASFDAVLLMGPLYHLTERDDRLRALGEARRVLRPGGVLVAAAISRFASTLDGMARGMLADPEFAAIVDRDLADGCHRNPTDRIDWFTTAYFHPPGGLAEEIGAAGLRHEATLGVEGPAWLLQDLATRLEDERWRERLLALLERLEGEPSLMGASAHLLAVARKARV